MGRLWDSRIGKQSGILCVLPFIISSPIFIFLSHRYNGNNSRTELYDLSIDLSEIKDVSPSNPSVVKMAQQYIDEAHVHGSDCIKNMNTQFDEYEVLKDEIAPMIMTDNEESQDLL